MPNVIDISASSMTGLLGAVEASKAAHSLAQKSASSSMVDAEYDISRYKKGSALTKKSSKMGNFSQRHDPRSNKGVHLRAMKDKLDKNSLKIASTPPSVQDQLVREALERKAKIYEASMTAASDEEELIESIDEFGRNVLIPASKAKPVKLDPQRTMAFSQTESASHLQEIGAQYGPQTSFPILEPNFEHPIKKSTAEEPIEKYFDPKAEHRQLGTAFYALSSNPQERQRQQEELRAREVETNQARTATSSAQSDKQLTPAQIALEARKRQLQLKKEELARKRMKKAEDS